MKKIKLLLLSVLFYSGLFAQCSNAPYGQYPVDAYTPLMDDSWEIITTVAWSGEYTVINVIENEHYQFLTFRFANGANRYLTITDEFDTPIVWGPSSNAYEDTIGWTATFTGTIKFFTHTNAGCGTNTQQCVRAVRGIAPPLVLPVEMVSYTATNFNTYNSIEWVTASETNCDYFEVEQSADGEIWQKIGFIDGSGTTSDMTEYEVVHRNFDPVINYYRLTQYDYDGNSEIFSVLSVNNIKDIKHVKTLNQLGEEISADTKGLLFEIYDDGTIVKKYK